jgi:hypothetical protein
MEIKKILTDFKNNTGTVWIWIGLALLLLNLLVWYQNNPSNNWTIYYGFAYSFGWLAVGFILSMKKPTIWGALCASFAGLFAVVLNLSALSFITDQLAAGATIVLFFVVLVIESGVMKIGKPEADSKYITMMALGASALWGIVYLYDRISGNGGLTPQNLPFQAIMYHGAIPLLAGLDVLTLLRTSGHKNIWKIRVTLAFVAIVGALLLTQGIGLNVPWGLTL